MADNDSHPKPEGSQCEDNLLTEAIRNLLGKGLGYEEWQEELETQKGFGWSENLKNTIIKQELEFFKDEVLFLKAEPNRSQGTKSKTNSLESILKRLQGLEWIKGSPNELKMRLSSGRLLGKDTKYVLFKATLWLCVGADYFSRVRCLQYHVSRWSKQSNRRALKLGTDSSTSRSSRPLRNPYEHLLNSTLSRSAPMETRNSKCESCLVNDASQSNSSNSYLNSGFLSTLGIKSQTESSIFEDREIPWIPQHVNCSDTSRIADITSEDFFHLVDQNQGKLMFVYETAHILIVDRTVNRLSIDGFRF